MKKSINLWAFPYPARMSLRDCLKLAKDAGFDGIELNYDLENDISPKAGPAELRAIRKLAEETGIAISRSSRRRGTTIPSTRSAHCWTAPPTGRPSWKRWRRQATQAISRSSIFIRSYTTPRPSSIRLPTRSIGSWDASHEHPELVLD